MYKDYRYINAGTNEIYRWGGKMQDKVINHLTPNEKGYYSIPVDGGKYWTIGTSEGKYGEFCKFGDTFFSVNKGGYAYAKVGSDKEEPFKNMLKNMLKQAYELLGCDEERIAELLNNL